MFSYRHAFHAGNHADVLKHITLFTTIKLLQKKEVGLTYIDTHAGTGIYDLKGTYAQKSSEAMSGIFRLEHYMNVHPIKIPQSIHEYFNQINVLNFGTKLSESNTPLYPGSAQLLMQLMRPQDRLRLMELHSTDFPILEENVATAQLGFHPKRDIQIVKKDGFHQVKAYLPPPSRRGLCLIDPSYENKQDYQSVLSSLSEAIKRFATGVYLIWYPILQRSESTQLPFELANFCIEHQLNYLQAELQIKSQINHQGLVASGMWIINPPWQLREHLEEYLPYLKEALGQDSYARVLLEGVKT